MRLTAAEEAGGVEGDEEGERRHRDEDEEHIQRAYIHGERHRFDTATRADDAEACLQEAEYPAEEHADAGPREGDQ